MTDTNKNVTGVIGIVVAVADAILAVGTPTTSQARVLVQLAAALAVVILGIVAAKLGSRLWLLLSGGGLLLVAFLIYAVVGP